MADDREAVDDPAVSRPGATARVRFGICIAIGVVVGVLVTLLRPARYGLLVGLSTVALTYGIWTWAVLRSFDARQTRLHARREDAGPATIDLGFLGVVAADLLAVFILLAAGQSDTKVVDATLAIGAIVSSWFLLHTFFLGRYARLYYADGRPPGGIDFNSDQPPSYREFAYYAFNIGMTYQVSDTAVSDPRIRSTTLRHCLMSYFLGTVILACAINLVVGVAG